MKTIDDFVEQVHKNFTYHTPKEKDKYCKEIRHEAGQLAELMVLRCPPSRELSIALTKLDEAVMWVNVGIARND